MRNRTMRRNSLRGMAVLLCLLLAALTAGCQLAQPEAAAGEDRLVGVYVTLEPLDLFDFAAYAQDHPAWLLSGGGEIGREEEAVYGGRLYAAREEDGCGWRFPETAGYAMFLYTDESEHGSVTASCCELEDAAFAIGLESSLEGTLYVMPASFYSAYCNPVYQSADGAVYLTAGEGISVSGDGMMGTMTQTISQTRSTAAAGDGGAEEESIAVTVHITPLAPPARVAVQQMRADGSVLRRDEYAAAAVPETIVPGADAAYLIVEMLPADAGAPGANPTVGGVGSAEDAASVVRMLLVPGDGSFTTYLAGADGVCRGRVTAIAWPEG